MCPIVGSTLTPRLVALFRAGWLSLWRRGSQCVDSKLVDDQGFSTIGHTAGTPDDIVAGSFVAVYTAALVDILGLMFFYLVFFSCSVWSCLIIFLVLVERDVITHILTILLVICLAALFCRLLPAMFNQAVIHG